jgi:acyl-CoA thioesterase I
MNRKTIIISASILIALGAVGYLIFYIAALTNVPGNVNFNLESSATNTNKETEDTKEKKTVVAFGDSLVYGTGSTLGNDFPAALSEKIDEKNPGALNDEIINMGIPGETTAEGLARIDKVLAKNPDIVIILLGGNDYLRQLPADQAFNNLEKIINRFKENEIEVVLIGIRQGLRGENYEIEFDELAKKTKVSYVPNILDGIITRREYMSDYVHPNDAGYAMMADKIYPILAKLLGK